jgi:RNA polymerase sigma-70 factor (ECF subfamily)
VSPEDLRDVRLTLDGQSDAYARIVRRYQQDIAGRMWRFTRDGAELEELVHDVFVEAYMSLASYRGQAPLVHWLQRIATRVGYRSWKRRKLGRQTVSLQDWDAPQPGASREIEAAEAAELVHSLLAQLPPRDRLVLTLLYLEELPVAEAARRAGWSQVMTKVQAHRARKKLKVLLEKTGLANQAGLLEDAK